MKRLISIIICALFTAAVLSGCKASSGMTEITFVLDWTPNTNHTGIYVADALGYFEENGISVTIEQPPEDGAEALIASGRAQFGISFQENIASSIVSDSPLPITAVAAVIAHNTSGVMSLADKGITSPKMMEGYNYATWDLPVEKAIIRAVVEKDGGSFDKIDFIPTMVTDAPAALQTDIDSLWVYYAWDGVAAQIQGLETSFFYFKDIEPALDYYTPVIAANDAFLKDHPETARAFVSAVKKGYEYCIDNPEDAARILCEAVPEIDPEIAKQSQIYLSTQYRADSESFGVFDPSRWDAFFGFLFESGVIDVQIPQGSGFTNDFIR